MSRHRFEDTLRNTTFFFCPDEQGELNSDQYRWQLVDNFVSAINDNCRTRFSPSDLICIDESDSRCYGRSGSYISKGLPNYVQLNRKPESGTEIKNTSCGRSGIMVQLELVKSVIQRRNAAFDNDMNSNTALVCRLVQSWAGSERIVCGDSFFASVTTAEELQTRGLKFIGVVKTAHRKYPMEYLSNLPIAGRFQHRSMVRKNDQDNVTMAAIVWADRDRRYFISTACDTNASETSTRAKWREVD